MLYENLFPPRNNKKKKVTPPLQFWDKKVRFQGINSELQDIG